MDRSQTSESTHSDKPVSARTDWHCWSSYNMYKTMGVDVFMLWLCPMNDKTSINGDQHPEIRNKIGPTQKTCLLLNWHLLTKLKHRSTYLLQLLSTFHTRIGTSRSHSIDIHSHILSKNRSALQKCTPKQIHATLPVTLLGTYGAARKVLALYKSAGCGWPKASRKPPPHTP